MLNDFTSSQDASQPMAHKKTRLSKTLGGLSSQLSVDDKDDEDGESMKDLVSPLRPKTSPPSHLAFSSPKPRSNPSTPRRQISYIAAMKDGELVSPQSSAQQLDMLIEESLNGDSTFSHQGLLFSRRQSAPPQQLDCIPSYTGKLLYQRQHSQQQHQQQQQQQQQQLKATHPRTRWSADNSRFSTTEIIGPSAPTTSWNNFQQPQPGKQESYL